MDLVLRLEIQFLENLGRHINGLDGIGAMDAICMVPSILFGMRFGSRHVKKIGLG